VPARTPQGGVWPEAMTAPTAAAYFDYETTGQLYAGIAKGEAPRPTSSRTRNGRREPLWALENCRAHIAHRHEIASDGSSKENIGSLV
jgi:hypothetical protein